MRGNALLLGAGAPGLRTHSARRGQGEGAEVAGTDAAAGTARGRGATSLKRYQTRSGSEEATMRSCALCPNPSLALRALMAVDMALVCPDPTRYTL